MSQNLKLEKCPESGCPTCRVYNLAQRQIGVRGLTDSADINTVVSTLQSERCPTGTTMVIPRPAHIKEPNVW
jgi:hypothetical protein